MAITTKLSALIDAKETEAGSWLVLVSVMGADGHELHTRIGEPTNSEGANHGVGYYLGALEHLGIPADLTARATELREWWNTDRFVLVYYQHHNVERETFPILEQAFSRAEGMEEYETGAPDEIREAGTDRVLYKDGRDGWERVASDAPVVDEFKT